MLLNQYVNVFAQNEITGPVILDLSLEDLDYMGISVLAHRKILLKAIEDLRKNKRVTRDLVSDSSLSDVGSSSTIQRSSSNSDVRIVSKSQEVVFQCNFENDSILNDPLLRPC